MRDIKNVNKISFFQPWWYQIITSSTSTIINVFILWLVFINVYMQYKAMNYGVNISDLIKLITTPWIIITIILYVIYRKVVNMEYFTIEGTKKFNELLDIYLYILQNKKEKWLDRKTNFILKNI